MPNRLEAINEVVLQIREFHRIGRKSLKDRPGRGGYAAGEIAKEAEKYALNPDTLRKARAFAEAREGYTAAEVDELCASIRTYWDNFTANGATIGRTHVIRLLNIPKAKGQRASVQKRMFMEGWSTAALESEILRRFGRRKGGGRKADLGSTLRELLVRLDRHCETWLRFHDQLVKRQKLGERPSLVELPPIRSAVDVVTKAMLSLRTKVGEHMPAAAKGRG